MISKYLLSAALAVLCLLPSASFALSDGELLDMRYEASPLPQARPNGPPVAERFHLEQACTLHISGVDDIRRNKTFAANNTFMLATTSATPLRVQSVESGDTVRWTRSALQTLERYGFKVQDAVTGTSSAAFQLPVSFNLRLVQGWSAGLNLVSHVVLRANYRQATGAVTREYHGMGTRTNWNNGTGEYMAVLNLGMEEALLAFAKEAASACAGLTLPDRAADL